MSVRISVESLSGCAWNGCPSQRGIRRSWQKSSKSLPIPTRGCLDVPIPVEPLARGLPGSTSSSSSWLHPLKSWSLRESRGGSKRPMADTVLASLEPEEKEYRENDGNGLYLRVRPDGSKSWQFRYKKPDGKWSWIGLGAYGKGSHQLTGEQARKEAAKLRDDAAEGSNPLATKRARKAAEVEAANNTFEHLAREWYATKRKGWSEGTAIRTIGALELHVFPTFGKRPYAAILPMEWMELLRGMEQKGIVEQTSRVRGMCREIYDLARVTGRAQYNPLEGLHKFLQTRPAENYAHVPIAELPALLRAVRAYGTIDVRIGLQLLSMLACRPSELREARWCLGSCPSGPTKSWHGPPTTPVLRRPRSSGHSGRHGRRHSTASSLRWRSMSPTGEQARLFLLEFPVPMGGC